MVGGRWKSAGVVPHWRSVVSNTGAFASAGELFSTPNFDELYFSFHQRIRALLGEHISVYKSRDRRSHRVRAARLHPCPRSFGAVDLICEELSFFSSWHSRGQTHLHLYKIGCNRGNLSATATSRFRSGVSICGITAASRNDIRLVWTCQRCAL